MLMVFSAFMSTGFLSCTKEYPVEPSGQDELESVVGKWTVGSEAAEYGSFEFTADKKYIISQRVSSPPSKSSESLRAAETVYIVIIFGDIASLSNSGNNEYTLDLSEFGTIVLHIDPEQGTASITVNGETYQTSKEKEIAASTALDLLCHTWNYTNDDEGEEGGVITFTKSGTYLIVWGGEDGDMYQKQNTFKLLSSTRIQMTGVVHEASCTGGVYDASTGEYTPGECTETEYEETVEATIEKLTESECTLASEDEDGDIFRIYLTR
jgi:hypothetical protein